MIRIGFKRKPFIKKCPICGGYPQWTCWEVIPNECVELWALKCDKTDSPGHYYHTSFWSLKSDAVRQWNRICEDLKAEIKRKEVKDA